MKILILVLELIIENNTEITYNIINNNNDFIFENVNTSSINLSLEIEFGKVYIFKCDADSYEKFILCDYNNFNYKLINNYITYDDINKTIKLFINDNNYPKEIYYHYKNINKLLGKFKLGIYNYYNKQTGLLLNTNYIDNINKKILNTNLNENIDLNIINYVEKIDNYKFKINLKKQNTQINISNYIIPHYSYNFIYENTKKKIKNFKIKKIYDILNIINTTDTDLLILEQPNYNLNINDKIVIIDNIPNTNIFKNSIYYIIFIDVSYKQIKLGSLETKALVRISSNNTYPSKTVRAKIYKSIDYIKSELIDKSIKINYLQPYSKIIDKSYNENISIINNDINYINISNNSYYNFISSNLSIIQNTELYNLKWNTPYGTIRFKLDSNSIINYINIQYSNTSNNNVKRIHLYYYENDKVNYIGSINDIKLSNCY